MSRLLVQHEENVELIFDAIHVIDFNHFMAVIKYINQYYSHESDEPWEEDLSYDDVLGSSKIKYIAPFYSIYGFFRDLLLKGDMDIMLTKAILEEGKTQNEYKRFVRQVVGETDNIKGLDDVSFDDLKCDVKRMKRIFEKIFEAMNRCATDGLDKIKLEIST